MPSMLILCVFSGLAEKLFVMFFVAVPDAEGYGLALPTNLLSFQLDYFLVVNNRGNLLSRLPQ
jgi:hypothetical protein